MRYLTKTEHTQNTRNNKFILKIAKLRTEFAKKSEQFMAAKMYNDLPIETRKYRSFSLFCDKLNTLFEHEVFPMTFIKNFSLFAASFIMYIKYFYFLLLDNLEAQDPV